MIWSSLLLSYPFDDNLVILNIRYFFVIMFSKMTSLHMTQCLDMMISHHHYLIVKCRHEGLKIKWMYHRGQDPLSGSWSRDTVQGYKDLDIPKTDWPIPGDTLKLHIYIFICICIYTCTYYSTVSITISSLVLNWLTLALLTTSAGSLFQYEAILYVKKVLGKIFATMWEVAERSQI